MRGYEATALRYLIRTMLMQLQATKTKFHIFRFRGNYHFEHNNGPYSLVDDFVPFCMTPHEKMTPPTLAGQVWRRAPKVSVVP